MSVSRTIRRYLDGWAEKPVHPLFSGPLDGLSRAIVIPALAERDSLFATLADLARQPGAELVRTLVMVVVNNRRPDLESEEDVRNNRETLEILEGLIRGDGPGPRAGKPEFAEDLEIIRRSPLRLAAVDASSPGFEIPDRDGVGLARKIGLDRALSVLDGEREPVFLVCLDADTRVDAGYLSAVGAFFDRAEAPGAVIDYAHQEPADPVLREAILRYEVFLRAYVLGLRLAGSPYAFHTVGSTIACTGEAYAAVRGMSRRRAGEDFYFLNKLAKLGPVGRIGGTVVRPSPRPSLRVPFGTGRRMARVLSGEEAVAGELYEPEIFRILREWIGLAEEDPDRSGEARLDQARRIHPVLGRFLEEQAFPRAWESIRRQAPGPAHLRRQFHGWFDAFRTLRAVHALRDGGLPNIPLLEGATQLLEWTGSRSGADRREEGGETAGELLAALRGEEQAASVFRRFHP
ncbi:MAG: glycosyltransferase family 2 protein [Syntrophaceae bacterium]|nr:glycosyltransferase family 2 protein [Syntrophaceae bacterium]